MSSQPAPAQRWRRPLATALVVLASLLAFLAIFAIWLNRQALNTDNWTRTSTQLLEQPVIRQQVAARLTDELFASVNVQALLQDVLPPRADALAGPAASALRDQIQNVANDALQRPKVQTLWADANRTAHEQLLTVLNGGGNTVSTRNGVVVLNLHSLLVDMQQRFGIGGRVLKVLPASASNVTLLRSDQLSTAQTVVKILKPLPVILILASLALFGIAVWIGRGWRRKALRAYGIGFVIAGVLALLTRSFAGNEFVSSLAHTAAAQPAVASVWSIATEMLVSIAEAAIGYGVVMVFGAWVAGPTRWAVSLRRTVTPYLREPAFAYGGLLVLVVILLWWAPTPAWRNAVMAIILIALLALGTEALRRQVIREFPDATRAGASDRWHERWESWRDTSRRRAEHLRDRASRTASGASAAITTSGKAAVTRFGGTTAPEDTRLDQLERLAQLHQSGVLDDEELRTEKERILHGAAAGGDGGVSSN